MYKESLNISEFVEIQIKIDNFANNRNLSIQVLLPNNATILYEEKTDNLIGHVRFGTNNTEWLYNCSAPIITTTTAHTPSSSPVTIPTSTQHTTSSSPATITTSTTGTTKTTSPAHITTSTTKHPTSKADHVTVYFNRVLGLLFAVLPLLMAVALHDL